MQKKMGRAPLELDWKQLMPPDANEPLPELEVVREDEDPPRDGGGGDDAVDLSDQQLEEKIKRMESSLATLKFPDGGAKLRASLSRLKEQRERRKLHSARKDSVADCITPAQSQSSMVSGSDASPCAEGMHDDKPCKSEPQYSFAKKFCNRLKERSDNAFWEELRFFGKSGNKSCKKIGQSFSSSRQETSMSVRLEPIRSVTNYHHDEANQGICTGNCKGIGPSGHSDLSAEGNLSANISEKRTSLIRLTRNSVKRKVETVVVLDEEDAHPVQSTCQVDKPDEWTTDAKIYYPKRSDPEAVELCGSDLDCLNPGSHLSSPIMNFYIQYLWRSMSSIGCIRDDYHFFNTYFYKKLEEAVLYKRIEEDAYYEKFRRWWKGVNIFEKGYIFLPIHADDHWSLAIICIPGKESDLGPIILHLDSLRYHNSTHIFDRIESFLKEEWNYQKQKDQPLDVPFASRVWKNFSRRFHREVIPVPQQKNDSDCGLFVLYFMERFILEAPKRLTRHDLARFGRRWFEPEEASRLRDRIRQLLCEHFELPNVQNGDNKSPSSLAESEEQRSDS